MEELAKTYNPKETEEKIYKLWEESGFFNPDNLSGEPFCIIMPPPNVTGTLHIGHALGMTIEDILIRYQRMRGRKTLWLPGTDHASIATQAKVESILYKEECKTRHDLGREVFLKRIQEFAQQSHDIIIDQIKKLGASCDWSREAFTLDNQRSLAVRAAFKKMYDLRLIYRGSRVVNWDPKLQTTISDDEIEWIEEKTPFYYLKYGPFTIATARPETKFGDKYVVMHPDDERYAQYSNGQKINIEWINGPIVATVIKDMAVDMKFGTGVMTITPWHDATDFEIAERHNLDKEQIIDFNGKLLPIAGELTGTHIKKARLLIIEKLKAKGLIEKIDESYIHRIATDSRGGGLIEPQIKEQWFIDVNKKFLSGNKQATLKEILREAITSGEIKIIPEHFSKTYLHWINNLRDWCISRQIWYGHQIPVWYKEKEIYCDINPPVGTGWTQDPDTLDTWFSSGLWTFSTLGWPNETSNLKTFHPTNILETGYDILFFWVARMILMTKCLLNTIPFQIVYLHGLVRNAKRQKMSKSKGNIIDPLEMTAKYGTDALRFALVFATASGTDIALSEDRIRGMKHFANKLWNIARFVIQNTEGINFSKEPNLRLKSHNTVEWEIVQERINEIAKYIDEYEMHIAANKLYQYIWHNFADEIIEKYKLLLKEEDSELKYQTQWTLLNILKTYLILLHPFMPFITEKIYQQLPLPNKNLLMVEKWNLRANLN